MSLQQCNSTENDSISDLVIDIDLVVTSYTLRRYAIPRRPRKPSCKVILIEAREWLLQLSPSEKDFTDLC